MSCALLGHGMTNQPLVKRSKVKLTKTIFSQARCWLGWYLYCETPMNRAHPPTRPHLTCCFPFGPHYCSNLPLQYLSTNGFFYVK